MAKVAFLGTGAMGEPMARNIMESGHELTVWNRTGAKTKALVDAGARSAETPADAARGQDFIVSMLFDDDASADVWLDPKTGVFSTMQSGAVAIECSTISAPHSRKLFEAAEAKGLALIDAPVLGTLPQAEGGELIVLAGGDAGTIDKARPVLEAMGKAVHHCGREGAGHVLKLMVNAMLGVQEALLAELFGMGQAYGVDVPKAFGIIKETPVCSPILKTYGQMMLDGADKVMFPVKGIAKDFSVMEKSAREVGANVPVIEAVRAVFDDAAAAGLADRNQTAIIERYWRDK